MREEEKERERGYPARLKEENFLVNDVYITYLKNTGQNIVLRQYSNFNCRWQFFQDGKR